MTMNTGHGHVVPRPDGVKARCGGPAICSRCQAERAAYESNLPQKAKQEADQLNGAEMDTLIALVEAGPLWDGDVPSKSGRDCLIGRGLAVRVVVKGQDGYTAATYAGKGAYKAHYDDADTISEATATRKARRVIRSASDGSRL
jgi:hypothetical protein